MTHTMRVSLPGKNALTDPDIDNYALYADEDNVLIKEHLRGSTSIASSSTGTVNHNLGYIPLIFVFAEVAAGKWCQVFSDSADYDVYAKLSTTQLILGNSTASAVKFKYYIFHDVIV